MMQSTLLSGICIMTSVQSPNLSWDSILTIFGSFGTCSLHQASTNPVLLIRLLTTYKKVGAYICLLDNLAYHSQSKKQTE